MSVTQTLKSLKKTRTMNHEQSPLSIAMKLSKFNYEFTNFVLNCKCYEAYSTEKAFNENIVNGKKPYKACYFSDHQKILINHQQIHVMLGSYIDFLIRGEESVQKSRSKWGSFIYSKL